MFRDQGPLLRRLPRQYREIGRHQKAFPVAEFTRPEGAQCGAVVGKEAAKAALPALLRRVLRWLGLRCLVKLLALGRAGLGAVGGSLDGSLAGLAGRVGERLETLCKVSPKLGKG